MLALKGILEMRILKISTIILSLLVSSLACNFGRSALEPTATIPVSTEAVEALLDKITSAEEQVRESGELDLVLSESEVTSTITVALEKYDTVPINDVQVFLRDDRLRINGSYQDGNLSLPLAIVAQPEVSPGGQFSLALESVKLGPVSAPDVLTEELQSVMDQQVTNAVVEQVGDSFVVTEVRIDDGFITIRGYQP